MNEMSNNQRRNCTQRIMEKFAPVNVEGWEKDEIL
jgi:hypothetical protein